MKKFIEDVETLNLRINNVITYIAVDSKGHYSECLNWTILITHNFQSFANVNGKLSTTL